MYRYIPYVVYTCTIQEYRYRTVSKTYLQVLQGPACRFAGSCSALVLAAPSRRRAGPSRRRPCHRTPPPPIRLRPATATTMSAVTAFAVIGTADPIQPPPRPSPADHVSRKPAAFALITAAAISTIITDALAVASTAAATATRPAAAPQTRMVMEQPYAFANVPPFHECLSACLRGRSTRARTSGERIPSSSSR